MVPVAALDNLHVGLDFDRIEWDLVVRDVFRFRPRLEL